MPIYNSNRTEERKLMNDLLQYRPSKLSLTRVMVLDRCTQKITESEYKELEKLINETKIPLMQINEDMNKALDDLIRAKVFKVDKETLL